MKVEKKYHLMKILACAAVILPVILIARYNRPCADDYAYTYMTHNALEQGAGIPGLIKAALDTDIKYYNSWQGLYTSAFVMALTPSVFGETYYVLCTYIILASVFLPLFFCIRMVGKSCGTSGQAGLPALFVTVYLALCMPSATQGLFWYNGAVNYISFTMLAVFNIILTCSLYCQNRDVSYAVRHMTAIVCSFVISGGNHVSAFANILILAMLTVCFASRRKFCGVMPLISGLAGFLVMYLAPGTAARQSVLAQSSIGKTVWMCGFHAVDAICSWMDLNYFVFLLVCVPSVYRLTRNVVYRVRKRDFLFLACAMYATVSGMFCAPYYASSSFGAGRLVNAVWIVFTFFSVAGLAAAVVYVRQHVGGGLRRDVRRTYEDRTESMESAVSVRMPAVFLESGIQRDCHRPYLCAGYPGRKGRGFCEGNGSAHRSVQGSGRKRNSGLSVVGNSGFLCFAFFGSVS